MDAYNRFISWSLILQLQGKDSYWKVLHAGRATPIIAWSHHCAGARICKQCRYVGSISARYEMMADDSVSRVLWNMHTVRCKFTVQEPTYILSEAIRFSDAPVLYFRALKYAHSG